MNMNRVLQLIVIISMVYLPSLQAQVLFEERSGALNLDFTNSVLEGTGISFCDFNNDGWDDITVGGDPQDEILFYQNIEGVFTPIFVDIDHPFVPVKQVVWVDYNNDGIKDLFIASQQGGNNLYFNNGDKLINVTEDAGLPIENIRTNTGAWGDYDNDGDLDLFLANRDLELVIPNMLYKNNGDGTFTLVNEESGIGDLSTLSFQGTFFDYDNDGWLDIYLINDRLQSSNTLYHNNGDGTFTDVSESSGSDYVMNAMSAGLDDYDADGYTDVYITNTHNPDLPVVGNALMKNNGDGTFTDVAVPAGVSFDSVGWGASFLDADNDGRLDLYVSGSNDNDNGANDSAAFYHQNDDQTFTSIEDSGFEVDLAISYGNAIGDFNNDGYPEIIVANQEPYNMFLFENNSHTLNANNYLKINLEGVESNRDGYGSKIEISIDGVKQYRITANVESYLSQHSDAEIFGVGEATIIDYVKVTWLSGQIDFIEDVEVNQTMTILEGQSPLGVDDIDTLSSIQIFPNPSQGIINLRVPQLLNVESRIEIYNTLGQLVIEKPINAEDTQIAITHLKKGTYFVSYYSNTELIVTRKLIKI